MKKCYHCRVAKTLDRFSKNVRKHDGLSHICRDCLSVENAAAYQRNKHLWYDRYHKNGGQAEYGHRYREDTRYRQMVSRVSRARRKSAPYGVKETFTIDDFETVFARFNNKCFNCGATDRDLQVDHHVPKHLGIPLSHTNAVLLCDACNGAKGRHLPSEFYSDDQLCSLENLGICSHTEMAE